MVDGVLASCYAFAYHDMAHMGMAPLRWFPWVTELVFGVEDGVQGYVNVLDHLGNWWFTKELRGGGSSFGRNIL